MTRRWRVEDAEARFDEFLEASLGAGPQIVARRGIDTAVLVSIELWRSMERRPHSALKDVLLAPEPRVDELTAPKTARRHRAPPAPDRTAPKNP